MINKKRNIFQKINKFFSNITTKDRCNICNKWYPEDEVVKIYIPSKSYNICNVCRKEQEILKENKQQEQLKNIAEILNNSEIKNYEKIKLIKEILEE